jgi:hypothetical protein
LEPGPSHKTKQSLRLSSIAFGNQTIWSVRSQTQRFCVPASRQVCLYRSNHLKELFPPHGGSDSYYTGLTIVCQDLTFPVSLTDYSGGIELETCSASKSRVILDIFFDHFKNFHRARNRRVKETAVEVDGRHAHKRLPPVRFRLARDQRCWRRGAETFALDVCMGLQTFLFPDLSRGARKVRRRRAEETIVLLSQAALSFATVL